MVLRGSGGRVKIDVKSLTAKTSLPAVFIHNIKLGSVAPSLLFCIPENNVFGDREEIKNVRGMESKARISSVFADAEGAISMIHTGSDPRCWEAMAPNRTFNGSLLGRCNHFFTTR